MALGIEITPGTFIVPDRNISKTSDIFVRQMKVEGFEKRGESGINPVRETISIAFRNRPQAVIDSLVAFFKIREGVTAFPITIPASGGGEETIQVVCIGFNKKYTSEGVGSCTANLRKVNIPAFDSAVGSQALP